jgi:flagellar biosynthesis protein FlhG
MSSRAVTGGIGGTALAESVAPSSHHLNSHQQGAHQQGGHDQAAALRRIMRGTDDAGGSATTRQGSHAAAQAAQRSAASAAGASISIGPVGQRASDQSETPKAPRASRVRLARAIAITSGKGGVGKTNLAVNLAIAMAHERRVSLLDADLGMANADVLCGLSPRATLEDVLLHGRSIEEVMVLAPGGFRLVPGASGVASIANLGTEGRRRLLAQLASLERHTDVLMIDTAAGIASNSIAFAAAAHAVLVAVTPEPTSITDAYGAVKTIVAKVRSPRIRLIVNMASDREEGEEVFRRIDRVSRTFLDTPLDLAGIVPFDPAVRACVKRREPVLLSEPDAPASRSIRAIARGLLASDIFREDPASAPGRSGALSVDGRGEPVGIDPSAFQSARSSFLSRLVGWLGRR